MGTNYWVIREPDVHSDYEQTWVHGTLERPFGMPGISCTECGQTWGASFDVVPFELPDELHHHPNLRERWPIDAAAHARLSEEVTQAFRRRGLEVTTIRPGTDFLPAYFDVPTKPVDDVLWPGLSMLVSSRVRDRLAELELTGVTFAPVTTRRIGVRSPTETAPIPESGEPEDLMEHARVDAGPTAMRYFEVLPTGKRAAPPERVVRSRCACGYVEIDGDYEPKLGDRLAEETDDVFFHGAAVVVAQRVYDALREFDTTRWRAIPADDMDAFLADQKRAREARLAALRNRR